MFHFHCWVASSAKLTRSVFRGRIYRFHVLDRPSTSRKTSEVFQSALTGVCFPGSSWYKSGGVHVPVGTALSASNGWLPLPEVSVWLSHSCGLTAERIAAMRSATWKNTTDSFTNGIFGTDRRENVLPIRINEHIKHKRSLNVSEISTSLK